MNLLFSLFFVAMTFVAHAPEARANSCGDLNSQESVGINLALQEAKDALPTNSNDLKFTVSHVKQHPQSKWDHYWYQDQPDYMTFDIVIGKLSVGTKYPYSPAVAYEINVDTNCKVSAQLMYSIE